MAKQKQQMSGWVTRLRPGKHRCEAPGCKRWARFKCTIADEAEVWDVACLCEKHYYDMED